MSIPEPNTWERMDKEPQYCGVYWIITTCLTAIGLGIGLGIGLWLVLS